MSKKNNLDERQEQTLLKIESRSFWLAFWLLVAAMIIQMIAFKGDGKTFAGEAAVLFIISAVCAGIAVVCHKEKPLHHYFSILCGLAMKNRPKITVFLQIVTVPFLP